MRRGRRVKAVEHKGVDGRRRGGFTLIETALALGVVSFALVGVLGMIPMGLTTLRDTINITVQTQIAQGLINDLVQSDYTALAASTHYYDEQGTEVAASDPVRQFTAQIETRSASVADLASDAGTTVAITIQSRKLSAAPARYSILIPRQ
ncbi:Verru_Chthon cassette protein B [Verrucomicrobium sp. GAS474]|uniref:Verru_Chthon cassette protein B n=1 Tax=Verrucomicrobium sp. GAS474 TaxID=1882831 RepID=UPI00087A7C14|nr:Verru_Chthon cassette protein B [Verrucomicrobium sp. GAS474]SDU03025.1 Verru_Chthon cassette protein B [Verrucomicrobium sp. GAS474]